MGESDLNVKHESRSLSDLNVKHESRIKAGELNAETKYANSLNKVEKCMIFFHAINRRAIYSD